MDLYTLEEDDGIPPTIYIFDYDDVNHVEGLEPPLFPRLDASFDLEPDWLNDEEGTQTNRAEFQDVEDLQFEVRG